jgi:hypothetical protein
MEKESTTLHVKKSQDMKLNFLLQLYIQKTHIRLKKVDFFDVILGILEKEINAMPEMAIMGDKLA